MAALGVHDNNGAVGYVEILLDTHPFRGYLQKTALS